MPWWGWVLGTVGIWAVVGVTVVCIREEQARQDLAEFALALVLGAGLPLLLLVRNHGPRAGRVSPEALALFARQQGPDGLHAFAFTRRGKGVILVRRVEGSDRVNDVSHRLARVKRDVAGRRS